MKQLVRHPLQKRTDESQQVILDKKELDTLYMDEIERLIARVHDFKDAESFADAIHCVTMFAKQNGFSLTDLFIASQKQHYQHGDYSCIAKIIDDNNLTPHHGTITTRASDTDPAARGGDQHY